MIALSPVRAWQRLPISARLGATLAAVFLAVLAGLAALAYWGLGQILRGEADRTLVAAADYLSGPRASRDDIDEEQLGGVESPEFETQVIGADGRVVSGSGPRLRGAPLLSDAQTATALRDGVLFTDVVDDDEPGRALAVPLDRDRLLVVVTELEDVRDAQAGLLRLVVVMAPLAALLAGLAGWRVARQGLGPIARMTADAEAISAEDLSARLALPRSRDEVFRLGTTLNGLLLRIQGARRRERDFTADASHELRTPLAILRAELELSRSHASGDELTRALDSALEETDRLGHLVDDLLLLARADAGHVAPRLLVDVAEATDGLLPGFRALADRRGITLTRTGDAVVRADGRALARALANLLDNAIRHAPDGGHVGLTIGQRPDGTAISVTDDGPGVPPAERERLVQRFAQLDRTEAPTGGAGLGLAIVASVAAAHDGRIEVADGPGGRGLSVTIHLPLAAGPPTAPTAVG
ncbi:sensor histidine kinase [Modestobacter sp. I12A-02662]|uniref:sensor histidine kinase n=1 Tax=Modestobacter sp. I12A-02662 TaxID=1730496 RepID=UPI0034DF7EEB